MSGDSFLRLDYRSDAPVPLREAIPLVLRDVHLFIVEEMRRAGRSGQGQEEVSISFPFASSRRDDIPAGLGARVVVCADAPVIDRLMTRPGFRFRASAAFDIGTGCVPEVVRHARFVARRRKFMSSSDIERAARRLARRAAERGDEFDVATYMKRNRPMPSAAPLLRIRSASNDGLVSRDLAIIPVDQPVAGHFCTFGLSRGASTPLIDV